MNVIRDFLARQVDMRTTTRKETFARSFQESLQFFELRKILCQDQVMNPPLILNFTAWDNDRSGIVFKKRFPAFPPYRMESITGAEYIDTFC